MDFTALFIIVIGFILVVVGWQGTYAKIWSGFSNIQSSSTGAVSGSSGNQSSSTTSSAPNLNMLRSSLGIPPGAPGKGQIP